MHVTHIHLHITCSLIKNLINSNTNVTHIHLHIRFHITCSLSKKLIYGLYYICYIHTFTHNMFQKMNIFHSYTFVTKLKVLWVHCRVVSPVSFTLKHIFGLQRVISLSTIRFFSDWEGTASCGLDRVPIRRPAHWILYRS